MAAPLSLLLSITLLLVVAHRPISARREVIKSKHGAVATDDGRCSIVGRDVLGEGGNAVDAAVAAALCLGVVSPASSGIGGGAFLVVRMADGRAQAFDMRETAPLRASEMMYSGNAASKSSGALSVAVPGEIAGLHEAWKQHGKLPWKRLVVPAESIARRGFRISPYLYMQMNKTSAGIFADRGLRDILTSNGNLLKPGDICLNKRLAQTLRAISVCGPKAFYNGSVGINLVKDVKRAGGILSLKDLQGYRVKVTEPMSADIMGLKILGMPPPSSGTAGMILILNILSQYQIPSGVSGSLGLHRFIESLKHMMAVRMNLGDPDFVDVSQVLSDMLSPKFAAELKKKIFDNMTFDPSYYGGKWNLINDHGTSHLSIIDGERNAISMTSTVNSYFGSQLLSPSTGILLNNEMDDFSIPGNSSANTPPPAPANFIVPRKRPLSSMTPAIVLKDGHLKAAVGASGGGMIIAATTQVFLNHFAKRMDPFSSVLSPRSYHQVGGKAPVYFLKQSFRDLLPDTNQNSMYYELTIYSPANLTYLTYKAMNRLIPNVVQYENWTTVIGDHFEVPEEERLALKKKGHVLQPLAGGTICQFVVHNSEKTNKFTGDVPSGDLTAVSDPRKGGFPAGY